MSEFDFTIEGEDQEVNENCDFIEEGAKASATGGLFTVDPPRVCYLGRFSLKKDSRKIARGMSIFYQGKWGADKTKYLFAYELSKDKVPHVHFICYHNKEYASSSMSDFWKGQEIRKNSGSWHNKAKTNEDIQKYLLYTIKDNDIIWTNLTDEELAEIKAQNDLIKADMELSVTDKLKKRLSMWHYDEIGDLAMQIIYVYVKEWKKQPPPNLKGLTIRMWIELGLDNNAKLQDHVRKMFI